VQVRTPGLVEERHEEVHGDTVNSVSFRQDLDGAALLTGPPGGSRACPCRGYVLRAG
jgi:hypothetical protein